jgi:hypothetical protein
VSTTLLQLIDRARVKHPAFTDVQMPEGAAVAFANERQRTILLMVIDEIEALIGQATEIQTGTSDGVLIAFDDNGDPYYADSSETGYATKFDANNVPYIDTDNPITLDPFGSAGDSPGFPLPGSLLRLISVQAMTPDNTVIPRAVDILEERTASTGTLRGPKLYAYINGARLIPVRQSDSDIWSTVTSIRLGVVLTPSVAALTDTIMLPDPLIDVLTAHLCEFFSTAARNCSDRDKDRFERQRKEADARLIEIADEILSSVTTNSVVFRG